MFKAPLITDAHPSYTLGDTILPQDAQRRSPVFRHTCINYLAPRTCRFVVRRPIDFVKLGHFLINSIDQISSLARPPKKLG